MKTKYLRLLLGLSLLLFVESATAEYGGSLSRLFLDRSPDARAEALGRLAVTLEGSAFASWANPAAVATVPGLTASFSTSSPYFILNEGRFLYLSAAYRVSARFAVGLSRYHFNFGESQLITDESGPEPIAEFTPKETLLRTTLAARLLPEFYVGINLNRSSLALDESHSTFSADIGLLKRFLLPVGAIWQQQVILAASLFNVSKAKLSAIDDELPQILRIGAAYRLGGQPFVVFPDLQSLSVALHLEFQQVLNSSDYGAMRIGAELRLLELVTLRIGYYSEDQRGTNFKEISYGFGLHLPLQSLTDRNIPLQVGFHFVRLPHPTVSKEFFDLNDFSIFSVYLNWQL
jgi:hypothetical protein